ncbi:MAG: hypothetical protein GX058_03025 [Firmicutes bacterium]|nr:hypothetical protein [Bacillota bacterium]
MRKVLLVVAISAIILVSLGLVALAADKVGCAACHTGNYSLAKEANAIQGHPKVADNANYDACVRCHGPNSKWPFGPILHKGHLVGADNHFITNYGGDCKLCHVLDANKGTFTIAK